ncbi:zinc finger protein 235-like [Elysia marginata]|uniref:Zinc finger protein 235-like n=1 Tax=Elysia marginata TaxID=1093978 RepID=A0AAV4HB21_9GAST|nr:zinc finger protein 235-like [Elysia marginata]
MVHAADQSLETPTPPAVESCKVCWTCRGLIKEFNEYSVKKHLQFCSQANTLDVDIEHFVCDKSDWAVFISLKTSLDKLAEDEQFFTRLQSILPQSFVNYLSELSLSAVPGSKRKIRKPVTNANDPDGSRPSYYVVANKESQANLEKTYNTTINGQRPMLIKNDKAADHSENNLKRLNLKTPEITVTVGEARKSPVPNEDESVADTADNSDSVISSSKLDSEDEVRLLRDSYQVKNNNKVVFVCRLCSRETSTEKQMLRHQMTHNDGQPFKCEPCKFSTLWRKEWKIHLQQKHRADKFLCHICASEFQTSTALDQHIVSSHPDINGRGPRHRLQCEHCDYVAREMASLKEHMRKHTGEKIRCPHEGCQFTSFYARSLNKHLRQKHSKEKTQCCYICGFQTRHASSLTKHITLVHKDFKPYKCAQCSFTALYPSEIISHAKSKHLKLKKFACPICPFKTSYQLAIQKHIARHSEPDGFACLVCGETLSSRNKAKKHMEKEHSSTHFQVVGEPSWEKVNANDYRIKEGDDLTLDLNNIVVLNNTQRSSSRNRKKGSRKLKDPEHLEPNPVFELPSNIVEASINTSIEEEAEDVNIEAECVDETVSFELPESLLQASSALENSANVSESLGQETSIYTGGRSTSAEGNPMLSGTTADFDDNENSLSSLFDLMSDFPRPSTLNRCQSASTLMFASLSPHLIDRPLTPDFFTDSPSVASFFQNFSTKNLETDGLGLTAEGAYENSNVQQTLSAPSVTNITSQPSSFRNTNLSSPLTPSFLYSPQPGTGRSLGRVTLSPSLEQESNCIEVDSVFSHLHACPTDTAASSAFVNLNQNFTTEIQAAVESIPMPERSTVIMEDAVSILQESPL